MTIVILIVSLVVAVLLLLKEFRRPNRARLVLRLLATLLATGSLAGLVFPVRSPFSTALLPGTAVVITEGTLEKDLDGLRTYKLFNFDRETKHTGAAPVADARTFFQQETYQRYIVTGHGFDGDLLPYVSGKTLDFRPSALPAGFTFASWHRENAFGRPVILAGKFRNPTASAVKLVVSGFGTVLDSARIAAGKTQSFQLRFLPKVTGKALLHLIALQGADTLAHEPVALEIRRPEPLRIVLLSESPGFEFRFLKNWLVKNGYPLLVRAKISQDKYNLEFLNTPRTGTGSITPGLLSGKDLVVATRQALNTLPAGEVAAISAAVARGLGLVITTDSLQKQSARLPGNYPLYDLPGQELTVVPLVVDNTRISLPSGHPLFIRPDAAAKVLIRDQKDRAKAVTGISGKGKVTLVALPETYPLELSGQHLKYSALWSLILRETARENAPAAAWESVPALSRVGERQELIVAGGEQAAQTGTVDRVSLAPAQDARKDWLTRYTLWPVRTGWHSIALQNGTPWSWYVYARDAWKIQAAAQRIAATTRAAGIRTGDATAAGEPVHHRVNPAWFLAVFLLSAGFLWAEAKFQ